MFVGWFVCEQVNFHEIFGMDREKRSDQLDFWG